MQLLCDINKFTCHYIILQGVCFKKIFHVLGVLSNLLAQNVHLKKKKKWGKMALAGEGLNPNYLNITKYKRVCCDYSI